MHWLQSEHTFDKIEFFNKDTNEDNKKFLRDNLGFVFQEFNLIENLSRKMWRKNFQMFEKNLILFPLILNQYYEFLI